ncbi:MAG: hypothetical protein RBT60_04280 [Candidatus Krumholzibacteria bacterium]|nr:hypothetical protein [Candidatus Krumholzibacteria bacterium]
MSIMDRVKLHLREWYSLAADRTGEMAKISVRMYDKYGISREIERQLSELGSYVYSAVAEGRMDFGADEAFQSAVARIQELEHDLTAKVAEIETIRQQRQAKTSVQTMPPVEPAEAPVEAAGADTGAAADRLLTAESGADPHQDPPDRTDSENSC